MNKRTGYLFFGICIAFILLGTIKFQQLLGERFQTLVIKLSECERRVNRIEDIINGEDMQ